MKKTFTLLLVIMLTSAFVSLNAQQIPNHDFENWSGGKPVSWDAPYVNMGIIFTTIAEETTNVYSGAKCVKMEAKTNPLNAAQTVPGFITLGTFDLASQAISGGHAFTFRPTKLKGFYKYQPASGDQAFFGVSLSKWNGTSADTIGTGLLLVGTAASTWSPFEVTIDWTSPDAPDSLNIIIATSNLLAGTSAVGSTLWLDSIYFEYSTVGVDMSYPNAFAVSNYPNPFRDVTNINLQTPTEGVYNFSVYNLIGVEVYNSMINAHAGMNSFTFSSEALPTGIYMYNIRNDFYSVTKSMVINK